MSTAQWILDALAAPYAEQTIEVAGCPIHTLRWGDGKKPGLILVHGGAANAHWWRPLAPMLMRQYDVVAVDMSGHGDSGHRDSYPRELWAREIVEVAKASNFPGRPMVVGHSLGGLVVIIVAALYGDALAGAILIDSPVDRPSPESHEGRYGRAFLNVKVYPDAEAAVRRFRLLPDQPGADPVLLDYVARQSYRAVPGGFSWKFDPRIFQSTNQDEMSQYLRNVHSRVALIRGELSAVVPLETGEYMYDLLDRAAPILEIPQGHHHLMFDQPLALVTGIRAFLADWEHSIPHKGRPL